jgi:hypothetical protein
MQAEQIAVHRREIVFVRSAAGRVRWRGVGRRRVASSSRRVTSRSMVHNADSSMRTCCFAHPRWRSMTSRAGAGDPRGVLRQLQRDRAAPALSMS